MTGFTQDDRLLRLTTVLGPDTLLAESVSGVEGISEGFRFDVTALSTDARIELKTLIGQPVLLELLTAASRISLRPFHGHITSIEAVGANGGLARYRLVIEPWTAFLGYTVDSTIYQDMTVFEILDAVFRDYDSQGKLAPAWKYDIRDRTAYPTRSLTTQYQESDLAFVSRLLREEGLFHWFEHTGNAASPGLGNHTLVIADHNGAFVPNAQPAIDFTQPGAVMKRDSIDRWRSVRRWQTNAIELASWDYRSNDTRPVSAIGSPDNAADATPLVRRDLPGAYSYETRAQGQRLADRAMQAIDAANKTFTGAGTVRTLAPGTTFILHGHAAHDRESSDDGRTFAILRVHHQMHNNLSADLRAQVEACLGLIETEEVAGGHGKSDGERIPYRNRIDAIRSHVPFRSPCTDDRGRLLHPRPTVHGQQTAIVVGPAGTVIHTDRDHRVKVQFHWQRGERSHSRLPHPRPHHHTGAPSDDRTGTWVRVAAGIAPIAGANWGGVAVPRVGQEVLVDFIEGDIDRPVIVAALYNGRGRKDAQGNAVTGNVGSVTGNAPAWFPGESGGHAHAAVLSGIKTQGMASSQNGAGAYNQLVLDDTSGESRIALQHHASAHQGTAELNLGHLLHQTDNQRLNKTGFGTELKTEYSAALRAGKGLLLTSDRRTGATGSQLDSREALDQVEQSHALQKSIARLAQQHRATLADGLQADKLPAIAQLAHTAEVLKTTDAGIGIEGRGGQGTVTAWSEPQLQLSSPAGIAATTPADVIIAAGNTSAVTAAQDINFAAQGNSAHLVAAGISLFTYGKAQNPGKPNQETGIKLHAASGTVSVQSQSDETRVAADQNVTVAGKEVKISAQKHALFTALGAFLKLEGGNITIAAPGKVEFKATMKEFAGPASASHEVPVLPKGKLAQCPTALVTAATGGASAI